MAYSANEKEPGRSVSEKPNDSMLSNPRPDSANRSKSTGFRDWAETLKQNELIIMRRPAAILFLVMMEILISKEDYDCSIIQDAV